MATTDPEDYRDLLEEIARESTIGRRAQILADIVSYEIWGGTRGWEKATDEGFETLVLTLKETLRSTLPQSGPAVEEEPPIQPTKDTQESNQKRELKHPRGR